MNVQTVKDVQTLLSLKTPLNTELIFSCEGCQKVVKRTLKYYRWARCEKLYCKTCNTRNTMIKKYGNIENFYKFQQTQRELAVEQKYGVKNISSLEQIKIKKRNVFAQESVKNQIRESLQKTCLEKYGETSFRKSKQCIEKIKQTCLEKYGVTNPTHLPDHKEKTKQTSLQKYGTTHPTQSKEVQEKIKQTMIQRYGAEYPAQAKEIKKKIQQTLKSPEVREKYKQTMLQRYGVTHAPSYKFVYKNQSFDSSWELAVWVWAIEVGKKIIREPITLEYEFENKTHTYYPDFEIDGQLVEVKGDHFFKKDGTMQHPYNHALDNLFEAKHQCGLQHNVQFWGEKEIKPIIKYVEEKYGKCWVKELQNSL